MKNLGKNNASVMKLNPTGGKVNEVIARLQNGSRYKQDWRETKET